MWKREIRRRRRRSRRASGSSARWLSIYQSAFWAGFMDFGSRSKRSHHARFADASFDSPCCQHASPCRGDQKGKAASRRLVYDRSTTSVFREGIRAMMITDVRAHHIRIPYDAGVASFKQGASSIAALEIVVVEVVDRHRPDRLGRRVQLRLPEDDLRRHRRDDRAAGPRPASARCRRHPRLHGAASSATCICSGATASRCLRSPGSTSRCGISPRG